MSYKFKKKIRLKVWFFIRNNSITCRLSSKNQNNVQFATGMCCMVENWDKKKEYTKNNSSDNAGIAQLRAAFEKRHEELLIIQKHHTLRQLFEEVWEKKETGHTSILVLIQEWQNYLESKIGTDLELSTFKSYRGKLNNIRDFVGYTKNKYLDANNWNNGVAMEFESYLKKYKGGHNHAEKAISELCKVLKFGYSKKYITSILVDYSLSRLPVDLVYLTAQEIELFANVDVSKQDIHVQRAKDGFLLQCYTGVAFAELTRLEKDTIFQTPKMEWKEWILIKRKKTKKRKLKPCIIPLLPQAKAIFEKYDYQIPQFQNGKYNLAIACIALLAGIKKDISSHNGRKSFGNYLSELGISNEAISKMYGHTSTRVTEHSYVEVQQTRIAREISKVFGKNYQQEQEHHEPNKNEPQKMVSTGINQNFTYTYTK